MTIRIPAEWEPHACCWMAWAVHGEWGRARTQVKFELSKVIQTIARFEPVRVLARCGSAFREAVREFSTCSNITVIEAPVDDIWMRDIAPTFALRNDRARQDVIAIDWNFNGWGGTRERPPRVGDGLAKKAAEVFGVPRMSLGFVAEGGAFVTDGNGTIITTRSCLLNPNRNLVRRRADCQQMIEKDLGKLGIRKVIWLEGDSSEPLTSGHADGYVLCAPGSVVLVEAIKDDDIEPPFWREAVTLLRGLSAQYPHFELWNFEPPESADLHAKLVAADENVALVGSSNLSFRGLVSNYEIGVVVRGEPARLISRKIRELLSSDFALKV